MNQKDIDRFWSKVVRSDGCWKWNGWKSQGYGKFYLKNKSVLAHRISYELTFGKPPDGMFVCHNCDNPECCNPYHLFVGTARDNNDDRTRKGRSRNGSKSHPERLPHGEKHHWTKISSKKVNEIRHERETGKTLKAIAKIFGVSFQHVSEIVNRKQRKYD